jgi:fused signal recognition particle receptor
LTKLDGSAKGGIAVAIQKQFKIPILWAGTGEGAADLQPFDPVSFVDALLNLENLYIPFEGRFCEFGLNERM